MKLFVGSMSFSYIEEKEDGEHAGANYNLDASDATNRLTYRLSKVPYTNTPYNQTTKTLHLQ